MEYNPRMKPFSLPPLPAGYRPPAGAIEKMVEENKKHLYSTPPPKGRKASPATAKAAAAKSRKKWVASHRPQWNAYMREWRRKKKEKGSVMEEVPSITPPSPDPL
jgi:hypothetical protein